MFDVKGLDNVNAPQIGVHLDILKAPARLMHMTVLDLIERLQEIPGDWRVYATTAGGSLEVRDPRGPKYAFVFTDGREPRFLTNRRFRAEDDAA